MPTVPAAFVRCSKLFVKGLSKAVHLTDATTWDTSPEQLPTSFARAWFSCTRKKGAAAARKTQETAELMRIAHRQSIASQGKEDANPVE